MGGAPRVLVFGAGAIGQWIGARFAEAGAKVTLLCRPAFAAAVRDQGLRVRTADAGVIEARDIAAVETLDAVAGQPFDWIFITVKTFDVDGALASLATAGLLQPQTRVMGFQNGVGTEDAVAAALAPKRTFVCVVTRPIAFTDRPAEVEEASSRGGISIAPYVSGQPFGDLEPALRGCGLEVTRFDDQRVMKWSKLLLNMTANATCAILDMTAAELYSSPALFGVERAAFREAMRVMTDMGIAPANLPGYPARLLSSVMALPPWMGRLILRQRVGAARGSKPPSLLLEMQRPRPESEVGWLNGAVAREAHARGLTAPINALLTETLNDIVSGRVPWDDWRHKPARLAEEALRRKKRPVG